MGKNPSAGHVSLQITGAGHHEVSFSFNRRPARLSLAMAASIAIDAVILFLLVSASHPRHATQVVSVDTLPKGIIWVPAPDPGGGGGGGGNKMTDPPRQAEEPGRDTLTVPAESQPKSERSDDRIEPNPVERLIIPAAPLASAINSLPGAIEAPPAAPTSSQGSGSLGGAGTGTGPGNGPGTGPGLGPGSDGGEGGHAYRPGSGVTMPVVLKEVKPQYTSDAMRARLQGSVLLQCVIGPDGTVGQVRVLRSLDDMFGLDLEAIKAARQWRFRPSTRLGEPVSTVVTIQLDFALR
jgi:protein TonB